jgi:hypothetical protein
LYIYLSVVLKKIILILIILSVTFCHAQEIPSSLPKAKLITGFPFKQFSGGVIVIKALLNNIPDTMNFILDTGSGGISLDSATCTKSGIKVIPSDTSITGMGGIRKVGFVFNQTLHLPGLSINDLNFHINDYALLSGVYGEKIDGIIGYGFFRRYIVKINFDSLWIDVYTPGKIQYPKNGTLLHPSFTTLAIQSLQVKDARKIDYNFYFDTGAGLCFLMSDNFVKDSAILLSRRKPVKTVAQGMGGRLQMELTVIKEVRVGNYKFRSVPTYIYKDEYNVTSYPFVGGLIGNDLLRRFNIILNYPEREIYLSPNSHFNDFFDYSYTGLTIYYENGYIMVDDVATGSPADKAGIKKDDILIAVDNNFSNNIQQYKTLLQSPNEKIKIVVIRSGIPLELKIKPTSIL